MDRATLEPESSLQAICRRSRGSHHQAPEVSTRMSGPTFAYGRGLARIDWKEPAVSIAFDQLRFDRRSGDLHGEISVQLSGHAVHQARLNLLSTQTKSTLAKHLATRTRGLDVDWATLLEDACARTIAAAREGQPAISLRDAERPPDAGWLLRPLIIGRMPTVIFGDGGSLKSLGCRNGIDALSSCPEVGTLRGWAGHRFRHDPRRERRRKQPGSGNGRKSPVDTLGSDPG
jgi:hypothetical protein